jgi:CRISPR-associated protein Csm3
MSEQRMPRLSRRYVFTGDLVLQTAMHIGGGDTAFGTTDSPVIRRVDGQAFIPGSSLKGAFRSTVEKLAATLAMPNMERDVLDTGSAWMQNFNKRRRDGNPDSGEGPWDEATTLEKIKQEWPATALLFGTPYSASKIIFIDASLRNDQETIIQRRDGVAIDRDSERAVDGLKYDYEVVPPTLRFAFEMVLENPSDTDLGLVCLGVAELLGGFFSIGGKRSSGMGRCLLEGLQIYALDLTVVDMAERARRLRQYLTGKTRHEKFMNVPNPSEFIDHQIDAFLQETN